MRSAFRPSQDASYQLRVDNRKKMRELMIHKPFGYGIGLSKGDRFYPKERMPYPPDSWLVSVWVETGIIGLVLYLAVHGVLFEWCGWQRRDAISQLHPHIHSLCPLLRRTVH